MFKLVLPLSWPHSSLAKPHERIKRVGERRPLAYSKKTASRQLYTKKGEKRKKKHWFSWTCNCYCLLAFIRCSEKLLEWKQGIKTVGCVSSVGSWPVDGNRLSYLASWLWFVQQGKRFGTNCTMRQQRVYKTAALFKTLKAALLNV